MNIAKEKPMVPIKPRLWPAVFIIVTAALSYLASWLYSTIILALWMGITVLATIAWLTWLLLLSRFNPKTKILVFVTPLLALAAVIGLLRIDYYDGDTIPQLTWRWTPTPTVGLNIEKNSDIVDLTTRHPHDVPEFLGRGRKPVFPGIKLDRDWNKNPPQLIWRQPIGEGFSSFAVVGDFAVTTQQSGPDELVVCYHWPTGKVRWKHADKARFVSSVGGNGPRTTPNIHNGKVYTLGATGILNCLSGKDGSVLWSHNIISENKAAIPMWGKSCSPLLYDDLVVVSAGGPDGHSLVAYQQNTGKLVWAAGSDTSGYSSPILVTLKGQRQVLIVNKRNLLSHDAKTGKVLWQHTTKNGDNCTQPLILSDDQVFYSKGYGRGSVLFQIDRNKNNDWTVDILWQKRRVLKTKFTNPVMLNGFVYGISAGSALQCVDPKNGASQWRQKGQFGHGQVLLVDELLLIQTEMGKIMLLEANPKEYVELSSFQALNSRTWNYPVLVGQHLLVRNDKEAACFKLTLKKN
jgi:outer membrane protein assembly factor BamB